MRKGTLRGALLKTDDVYRSLTADQASRLASSVTPARQAVCMSDQDERAGLPLPALISSALTWQTETP